jgi:hypothetical protein
LRKTTQRQHTKRNDRKKRQKSWYWLHCILIKLFKVYSVIH